MASSPDLPKPKTVRMPTADDPNADKARMAFRRRASERTGRRSTIMSESLKDMTGSTGKYLGGGT